MFVPSAAMAWGSGLVRGTISFDPQKYDGIVWHSSTQFANGTWTGVGDAFAPHDGSIATEPPTVDTMSPFILDPKGGERISVRGSHFRSTAILVKIGEGGVCSTPTFVSTGEIICTTPPGVGGPLWVTVTCGDVTSTPRSLA